MKYRIHVRRSLYLNDYIVLIETMCFCATIELIYKNCDNYFLNDVMQLNHFLFLKVSFDRINELFKNSNTYFYVFFAFIWITIFVVKFFFLTFFKRFIERVTKIQKYYWIVMIIILISWIFLMMKFLILCFHFSRNLLYVSMSKLVIDLNVFIDFFNKSSMR